VAQRPARGSAREADRVELALEPQGRPAVRAELAEAAGPSAGKAGAAGTGPGGGGAGPPAGTAGGGATGAGPGAAGGAKW
jgi:hypothetical protein